ncbi:hypothetical protein TCAL_04772 [Tigriopus californicus]|uniref:Protein FAM50 homolog n=2 Tax=Tigriopus californicus TaxID=6832 RepID=A0A553P312_TIGCA|nr:protein FAM50 homolog isoform X2 [Tigriopus californicus]TRY72086.1 hypothetical protein TCAL_04772 [Tigriopus californicus]
MAQYKGPASESQRVMHLTKKRERQQEEIEIKKKKLAEDLKFDKMESKFSAHYDAVETNLKSSTVGLLTVDEMKSRQEEAVKEREKLLARRNREELQILKQEEKAKEEKRRKQQQQIKALSFNPDDDDEEEEDEDDQENDDKKEENRAKNSRVLKNEQEIKTEPPAQNDPPSDETKTVQVDPDERETREASGHFLKRKRLGKNPDVDTSFLPDVDRDEEENQLREKLRQEWESRQRRLKEESIHIVFSYWDGSGQRRSLTMKKGHTIYNFLQKSLETLRPDFTDLRTVTADQLMYVKEDLIIPQTNTFYDFIVTKARGKSGPLFSFDVHDDIRLVNDATVEKDESHAGKVVLRSWYERNKHIFPASRWEPYDPTKTYDKYTVHDKK